MKFKTILTACALTGLAFAAHAANRSAGIEAPPLPRAGLPAVTEQAPVVLAQVTSPEMIQLQEQVRSLNGKVEELTFQLLQLQEQLRKMQEDNDFRFQQMEDQRGDAGPAAGARDTQVATAAPAGTDQPAGGSADNGAAGGLPAELGTIEFDADGNVVGSQITTEPGANGQVPDGQQVAAIPETTDAGTLYRMAYEMILNGDYASAEAAFGAHVQRFPDDAQTADARYWLGEAQLGQNKFQQAAETFLNASRSYPNASKAPDMLLKLGVSLSAMNNRDLACEMFAQIPGRYPDLSAALSKRLNEERAKAAC